MKRYILAITGASGSIFGIRILKSLVKEAEVHLIISSQSFSILHHETGIDLSARTDREVEKKVRTYLKSKKVYYYNDKNMAAPISSGSFKTSGMLVVPCSMKTLSGIANGYANTLVERAADVTIKEGRPLLLSPREMPFSVIHLENMLKLSRTGVIIAPPVPAFYHRPNDLNGIIDFVAGKVLDCLDIKHNLFNRWGEQNEHTIFGQ